MVRAFVAALGLSLALCQAALAQEAKCTLGRLAELPIKMEGLRPIIEVKIDGKPTRLLVDTGAFFSSVTRGQAEKIGMKGEPLPLGMTVGGLGGNSDFRRGYAKSLELGKAQMRNLDFLIGGSALGGADGLLGQNIIGQMDVEFDLANGVMRIFKPDNCRKTSLAYWALGKPYSVIDLESGGPKDYHFYGHAKVNGRSFQVAFDTGAPLSVLKRSSASKVGFSPTGKGVQGAGIIGGIGSEAHEAWLAPFDTFAIGSEEVRNTRLTVSEVGIPSDMLIGADFFLSHRVLFSNSQNKIYFTYNGGPVFRLERPTTRIAVNPKAVADDDSLPDAGAYSRRGAAFAARGDFERAVADFTRATELEPENAQHYLDRGRSYARGGRPRLALADADKALLLKPDDADALIFRARVNVTGPQPERAIADLDAAVKARPDDDRVQLDAGAVYLRAGHYEKAIGAYDAWIARHKNDDHVADVLNARCWARAVANQDLDKALADCNQALRERSKTSDVLDSRGLVHLRRGELKEAVADYDEALRLQPRRAWSLYGRGLAKIRMGRAAEGQADIAAARQIDAELEAIARRFGLTPSA